MKGNVWGIGGTGLFVGLLLGLFVPSPFHTSGKEFLELDSRERNHAYEFISPLLACSEGSFDHLGNAETATLEKNLTQLVSGQKASGAVVDVGIYFRQLKGGPWVGVNYDAAFTPGSLLKVPLVMGVYKQSLGTPEYLDREITYTGEHAPGEPHFLNGTITPGTYSIRGLIRATLIHSDNNAAMLLSKLIGPKAFSEAYADLGIDSPAGEEYTTTVRNYASFFRVLYNATYVGRTRSEEMLKILSESNFKQGLVAGVPTTVVVSHKFGERAFEGNNVVQLHDCGIVYHSERPYLLCVMMRGTNFEALASAIASVSRLVYQHVDGEE